MLYYLFEYLEMLDFPGAGVFQYISFRAAISVITSLVISMIFGKGIIRILQRHQIGETVRDLGLEGQMAKQGTPTMGGLIILASIFIPTLLFGDLGNIYIQLMLITTLWMGLIGFIDDYIKVYRKNKKGLRGKFKVLGQIGLGLIVGITLYASDDVIIRDRIKVDSSLVETTANVIESDGEYYRVIDHKSTLTTIPFLKNNEFNYAWLVWFMGDKSQKFSWIVFVLAVIFIVTAPP